VLSNTSEKFVNKTDAFWHGGSTNQYWSLNLGTMQNRRNNHPVSMAVAACLRKEIEQEKSSHQALHHPDREFWDGDIIEAGEPSS
jgi:hypothetical protein